MLNQNDCIYQDRLRTDIGNAETEVDSAGDSDVASNIRYLPEPTAVSASGEVSFAANAAGCENAFF